MKSFFKSGIAVKQRSYTPTRPPPSRGRGIASLPVEDPPQACAGGIEREGDKMISALLLFIEP